MAVLTKADIAALSPSERLALIEDLWDSFEEPPTASLAADSVPEWQRTIVDERLLDLEESPEHEIGLAEARKQSLL